MALKPVFFYILNSSTWWWDPDLHHHIAEKGFEVDSLPSLSGLQFLCQKMRISIQLSLEYCGLITSIWTSGPKVPRLSGTGISYAGWLAFYHEIHNSTQLLILWAVLRSVKLCCHGTVLQHLFSIKLYGSVLIQCLSFSTEIPFQDSELLNSWSPKNHWQWLKLLFV